MNTQAYVFYIRSLQEINCPDLQVGDIKMQEINCPDLKVGDMEMQEYPLPRPSGRGKAIKVQDSRVFERWL